MTKESLDIMGIDIYATSIIFTASGLLIYSAFYLYDVQIEKGEALVEYEG